MVDDAPPAREGDDLPCAHRCPSKLSGSTCSHRRTVAAGLVRRVSSLVNGFSSLCCSLLNAHGCSDHARSRWQHPVLAGMRHSLVYT